MRPYEIVVIFDASLDESVIRATTDRVLDHVRSHGGSSGQVMRWGRRSLAYEINHHREGYYVILEVAAEPGLVAEVDRMLVLADEVLRHKVIRQPDKKVAPSKPKGRSAVPEMAVASQETGE